MPLKEDLIEILGKENVFDDEKTLRKYSSDQSIESSQTADLVVFAQSVEQVQEVIKYAIEKVVPVIPFSSELHLHGAAVSKKGGIILNLSKMNRVIDIDADNRLVVIEPGVTFSQLQDVLGKKGLRAMIPFGAHPDCSALSSWVECDPVLMSVNIESGNDLLLSSEIVLPNGKLIKTGFCFSEGSMEPYVRPEQGTMGLITRACFKVEQLPAERKIYALQFESFNEVIEPLKLIQTSEAGFKCFLLNHFNMATLFSMSWQVPSEFPAKKLSSNEFESLRSRVPTWTLIVCLSGGSEFGAEKKGFQENVLEKISLKMNLIPYSVTDQEEFLQKELLRPWNILKKFCFRGTVHDLSFKVSLKRFPELQKIITETAKEYGYSIEDIGGYIQPIKCGRVVYCEFDFHCNPEDSIEKERIKSLWLKTREKLVEAGAFFDSPC